MEQSEGKCSVSMSQHSARGAPHSSSSQRLLFPRRYCMAPFSSAHVSFRSDKVHTQTCTHTHTQQAHVVPLLLSSNWGVLLPRVFLIGLFSGPSPFANRSSQIAFICSCSAFARFMLFLGKSYEDCHISLSSPW